MFNQLKRQHPKAFTALKWVLEHTKVSKAERYYYGKIPVLMMSELADLMSIPEFKSGDRSVKIQWTANGEDHTITLSFSELDRQQIKCKWYKVASVNATA